MAAGLAERGVTAVVMTGEFADGGAPVDWVQGARLAATRDLVAQLLRQPLLSRLILVAPQPVMPASDRLIQVSSSAGPIHIGQQLAHLVAAFGIERLLYFGGGSAPLLPDETLAQLLAKVSQAEALVITNNRFGSDWAGVVPAASIAPWSAQLPRDNMLGWVLSDQAGLPVEALPARAATRLDIDTPTDLLALHLHPATKPALRAYLDGLPLEPNRLRAALAVLATPAQHVFIAGRMGPEVWLRLNEASHCWLRVVTEERGMVSSGRQARGEVYSLLGEHLALVGPEAFFAGISRWAGLAFIDSRVLLAHAGDWPPPSDRFASDLGLVEQIASPWLRRFTQAACSAAIPVVLGGHSLLAGDMLALCELLA